MQERIFGMQDTALRYPAPDPLAEVQATRRSPSPAEDEPSDDEPAKIEEIARPVGHRAMQSIPEVKIRRLPVPYDEQRESILKERQRFMPY